MRKAALVFAVATALAGSAASAAHYTVKTIDFPDTSDTLVASVNDAGRTGGAYRLPTGKEAGFTELHGTFTSVGGSLPCRPNGRCNTSVFFVNDRGTVAGAFSADVDTPGAFLQPLHSGQPSLSLPDILIPM